MPIPIEIAISKSVMPEIPEGFEQTILGSPEGAIRQYRGKSGLHVREYGDRFVVHQDSFDPRENPLGHLLFDSPETLLALGSAAFLSIPKAIPSESAKSHQTTLTPLSFLFAFISMNRAFRVLKHIFFG